MVIVEKRVLILKAPRTVSDSIAKFSTFFNDLHKILSSRSNLSPSEKKVSLKVILKENYVEYQISISDTSISFVESLLKTNFPGIDIQSKKRFETKSDKKIHKVFHSYKLKRSNYLPLKTKFSEGNDPYYVISSILPELSSSGESLSLEISINPSSETWFQQLIRERFFHIVGAFINVLVFLEKPFLERESVDYYKQIKSKFSPKLFRVNINVLSESSNLNKAQENAELLKRALGKTDNGDVNSLVKISRKKRVKPFVLNSEEVASIFHFPDSSLEISSIAKASTKKLEPPQNVPKGDFLKDPDVSIFAKSNFYSNDVFFGIRRVDRNRHMYITGKTGMGKSKLIELLVASDIASNKGVCVIDPHGDLAINILKRIPKERINDVIYFNPADDVKPIAFNPMYCSSPESKHQVVTGFISIFRKLFSHNWTSRLEHMFRYILLALLDNSGGATVIDIVKMLTDVDFRQSVVAKIKDPIVKKFWTNEFSSWNERFENEAIIPIVNNVGQFISNEYIRNVVGQKKSSFDFHEAMQNNKIIIINIAKGKIGEDNTALLGSMIITKIQEATMSRVNLPEKERKEFYLYVDEFQHFATDSFDQILSEARKFNLSLTIAHQYLGQLNESIRKTVFGNVGTLVSFRVGAEDAELLSKEFLPQVSTEDLINLDFRDFYAKLSIVGKTSKPLSGHTIKAGEIRSNYLEEVIKHSQDVYGNSIKEIKSEMVQENSKSTSFDKFEEPIV